MKATDVDLARLALERGWISVESYDEALAQADRCQAMGLDKPVEEILIERGQLEAQQVRALREDLGWTLTRPRIGDYEVLRRIGLGGMGTVFEARHVRLKQRSALKILLPRYASDPAMAERFLREARTLARLNHPHLVHAMDSGRDGEYFYLALEFVEGEDLRQRLARVGALEIRESLRIVRAVCSALHVLEEKGLVHQDVKPANILLGVDGSIKLADLGILRSVRGVEGGQERFVCGTPHYVSPEQVLHRDDVDIRSDLYSLAATWYHMLAGRPPFMAPTTGEVFRSHLDSSPSPLSALRRKIPAGVERTVFKWLSREPAERPSGALAAIAEVDRLILALRPWRRRVAGALRRATRGLSGTRRTTATLAIAAVLIAAALLAAYLSGRGAPRREPEGEIAQTVKAGAEPAVLPPEPDAHSAAPSGPRDSAAGIEALPVPSPPPSRAGEAAPPRKPPDGAAPEATAKDAATLTVEPSLVSSPQGRRFAAFLRAVETAGNGDFWLQVLTRRWKGLDGVIAEARSRLDRTQALAGAFHALSVALEPRAEPPLGIILKYGFLGASELDDFRAPPGAWSAADGQLRSLEGPAGQNLDTIAWFTPPVIVDLELPLEAPFVLGFGALRVAPGRGADGRVWRQEGAEEVPVLAAPQAASGLASVSFLDGAVELTCGGRSFRVETAVPERGRLVLRLAKDRPLSGLRIEGRLDAVWASERLRRLEGR